MTKYNNKKAECNGIKFDSIAEAKRYVYLFSAQDKGLISELRIQVPYELIPAQYESGTTNAKGKVIKGKLLEKSVVYKADFVYKDSDGNTIVEDTKGVKTKDYIIKRKLMLYVHGIKIKEVKV